MTAPAAPVGRAAAAFALAAVASLAAPACRREVPARVDSGLGDFAPLGKHPGAARQRTPRGRILATLAAWEGYLYAGYGDINANTGPIAVMPFDPATATFVHEWTSDTEALYTFRPIARRLFAPALDPRGKIDFSMGRPWRDVRAGGGNHLYDMATLTGADLWLVGSEELDAVAWRSLDGGETWSESLRIAPESAAGDDYARFFFVGAFRHRLWVHARDAHRGPKARGRVFDGTGWAEAPGLLAHHDDVGWHPHEFAGRLVYLSGTPVDGPSRLLTFDGGMVAVAREPVWDAVTAARALFVLGGEGSVFRTTDLATWVVVARAPPEARSLGALGGFLYVGTTGSELLRSRRRLY